MIEESKDCTDFMKKYFKKELMMTKINNEDFKNSTKYWICDNIYVEGDVKVKNQFHITENYRCSAHRDFNINVRLSHKIPIIPKNYDSHLIVEKIGKFNFNINVITNGLEKYMSFNINNKFIFVESFQFLSSS